MEEDWRNTESILSFIGKLCLSSMAWKTGVTRAIYIYTGYYTDTMSHPKPGASSRHIENHNQNNQHLGIIL